MFSSAPWAGGGGGSIQCLKYFSLSFGCVRSKLWLIGTFLQEAKSFLLGFSALRYLFCSVAQEFCSVGSRVQAQSLAVDKAQLPQ